jgi:hypothetical protein
MPLWTDIIDPADLTGYARESLADFELRQGTLARWLPNRDIADIVARFVKGGTGLVDTARFRAFDAEPEIGRRDQVERVTIELPAISLNIPVSEYEQLRLRSSTVPEATALATIQTTTDAVVRAVADGIERLRGIALQTGKATINQTNFKIDDDFGRPATHQLTASSLWTTSSVSRLEYLQDITEVYVDTCGEQPGSIVMSTRVFRALAQGDEFQTQLIGGSSRLASPQQVRDMVSAAGLPDIEIYDRRVVTNGVRTRVLTDDTLLLLPAPVDPNDWQGTDLGATFWGRTLTSTEPGWSIPEADQPGIVAGVWKNDKIPMGLEIVSDAIALPVLAQADRSLAAKVL